MSKRKVHVYAFGAGASKHVGGPLIKDFLYTGFHGLSRTDLNDISVDSFEKVACLIDSLYGSHIATIDHWRNCYDKLIDYKIALDHHNCFITFNCRNCDRWYLAYFDTRRSIHEKKCECGHQLLPILVPPTFRKQIEEYGIGSVWDKAEDIVSKADDITIIGYSFPDADIEARWLFKRSLCRGGKKPSVTLVEPNAQVREKIIKIFGDTIGNVTYFDSFEDYCGNA